MHGWTSHFCLILLNAQLFGKIVTLNGFQFTAKKKLARWLNDNHWIVLDFASSILLLAGSIVDLQDRIRVSILQLQSKIVKFA